MHIITKKRLVNFWKKHQDTEKPLRVWHTICKSKNTKFKNFADLKTIFSSVDKVGKFTVFDIGGNKCRLITVIHYESHRIYIRAVLTHKDYDKDHWKNE